MALAPCNFALFGKEAGGFLSTQIAKSTEITSYPREMALPRISQWLLQPGDFSPCPKYPSSRLQCRRNKFHAIIPSSVETGGVGWRRRVRSSSKIVTRARLCALLGGRVVHLPFPPRGLAKAKRIETRRIFIVLKNLEVTMAIYVPACLEL